LLVSVFETDESESLLHFVLVSSSFETNQVINGKGEEDEEEGLDDSVVTCVSFIFLCILRHRVNTRAFIQTSVAAVFLFTAKAASQFSSL